MTYVRSLGNAVEVIGADLEDDDSCRDLGRTCADACVVLVRDKVSEKRLFDMHNLWGQPAKAILHRYVGEQRLTGRHWRSLLVNLGYISTSVDNIANRAGMSRVSFEKNKKGRPTGIFTNGELDWHSDQQGYHDNQRVVGLMSLWGSENSQTSFLCTAPVYEALNHEDRTMVDELYSVWAWDGGRMAPELIDSQQEIVRYNMVPSPGMETALLDQTATGRKGIRFPSHCFSHFRGMTQEESLKFKKHLWSRIDRPEYVYTHDWQDGEIMFFDQNITLHARPTNVRDGDKRTMSRMISYMDNIYPGNGPADHVFFKGEKLDHDEFAMHVDAERKVEYEAQKGLAVA